MRVFVAIVALCAIGAFAGYLILRDNDHWRDGDPRHTSRGAFRGALIALVICFIWIGMLIGGAAHARPSPYPPVTPFNGDRYAGQAQMGPEVVRAVRAKRGAKARPKKLNRRATAALRASWRAPTLALRPLASEGILAPAPRASEAPISVLEGVRREVGRVGRPVAWCGWWLGQHLGMPARHLWLARNWAAVGSRASGPQIGAVVVWRHHVGIITGRHGNQWVVKSGNDGRRVRERPRSVAGAIAFRTIGGRG